MNFIIYIIIVVVFPGDAPQGLYFAGNPSDSHQLQKVDSPSGDFQSIHWENVITSYLLKLSIPASSHYGIKVKCSAFNMTNAET